MAIRNQPISGNYSMTITTSDIDHFIAAVGRCKDPSTPSGYGPPRTIATTSDFVTFPVFTTSFVYVYTDERGFTHTHNSCSDPEYSAPYSIDLSYSSAYYQITLTNCPGTGPATTTIPTIRYGLPNTVPGPGTITSKTFAASC